MERQNIIRSSDEEKAKVYLGIHNQWLRGVPVTLKRHRSGFPAVTVDCGDEHIITDILSLEQWWQALPAKIKQRWS